MQLIIEIYAIKNCIEQLRSLAKQYESYTEVFAPSNFSVPSGTPLSRKLTDIRNNYRGIQINLQIVAQYLEYYVNDLENLENRMGNLGAVSSFHSSLSFGSISETSGLVDKPYEFPKTRLFDGASNVAFADSAITEEVKYASFEDINRIMCGDELLQTKETQALMQRYQLNSEQALYILHKARGLQFGEKKADGKPYLAPEVLKEEDTQITPIEAAFFNNYMSLASTYQMDALKAIKENSKSSIKDIDNIEKKLRGYNFSSLENYQNAVQTKYALAKDEAKLEVSNFRTKQEWAARIGLSLDQVSKMRDDELIETIVKKDRLIGSDYKKVLAIGDKVGFGEKDQKRLYKLQSDYNNSSMAILQLEENARVQPYLKVQETQDFQKFHYEVPKVKIEKHYDQHDSGFMYNSSVDEYTYYKNCQEQYSYVNDTEIMGMKNLEAVCDLQSIAELYPKYEKEYYYYLETKGKAGAEQYLNDMKSTFARLSGEYKASKRLEHLNALPEEEREKELSELLNSAGLVTTNALVSSAYGVGDGVTGWFENLGHIGDQKRYLSSHEWEKNYFRTAISSEKSRTEGNYIHYENGVKKSTSNVIDFTKTYGAPVAFVYDVGQGAGNMLPTMVASSVFAPAGMASRVVGGITMGAGIYGGTYHDYMVQGYDESTAHKAAALSAIAETATEEFYGGFSFLNGGPVYNFKTGVINVLKEGGQEVFQDANDPIIHAIVTGEKIDLSKINVPDLLKKEAYTFVVGGATAGVMNLPGQVSSSHSIKVNQSNLNLLGNYYNNGNITMDQLHDLVSSTLGISELENSDIASILKFNKNGLSTISKTANGTINPDLVLALGEISAANNIVVQQRDLVKNTPALAPYVSNISQNENAVVPDGIKDAYTKYKSLEEKLNSYGEEIKNSAKQFQLKDDSVKGLNKKMQDLKSQHVGLEELLEKYDAGEKVHVPKDMSDAFSEYLDVRYQEKKLSQQIEEISSKVSKPTIGDRVGATVSKYYNQARTRFNNTSEDSAVVGIVPPAFQNSVGLESTPNITIPLNDVAQTNDLLKLDILDQIQYINHNFTIESFEITALFSQWNQLDPRLREAIQSKMIQDQNYIFSSESLVILASNLKDIINQDMVTKLSDLSLLRLLATSEKNHVDIEMINQEISNRLDAGDVVIDQFLYDQSGNEGGFALYESVEVGNHLSSENIDKISQVANSTVSEEIRQLSNIYRENCDLSLFQLLLLRKVLTRDHSESVMEILNHMYENNPKVLEVFNFELLNPEIIELFGKEFIEQIGVYQHMSNPILDIYKSDPELLRVYAEELTYLKNVHDPNFENNSSALLEFLHKNAQLLRNTDLSKFKVDDLINYALLSKNSYVQLDLDSRGFSYSIDEYIKQEYNFSYFEELQSAYLLKKYSMPLEKAISFMETYGQVLSNLNGFDESIGDIIKDIDSVLKMTEESSDILKNKIQSTETINPLMLESVKTEIRNSVFAQFEENFKETEEKYGRMHGFQKVDVYGPFSLVVKSTNSGIAGTQASNLGSYEDYLKSRSTKTHLLAGSYINESCLYTAEIGEGGVLFGWSNMTRDDMKLLGSSDIKSDVNAYGYKSTRDQKYASPEKIAELTLDAKEYNEIVTVDKKPQYIVIMPGFSEKIYENSMRVAKDFDIPVLIIHDSTVSSMETNESNVVETLENEDTTFTIDDIQNSYVSVSLNPGIDSTATLMDSRHLYDIIFNPETYNQFMNYSDYRDNFNAGSYPMYLQGIQNFIVSELDGKNFSEEITQRIMNLLSLSNYSHDFINPPNIYSVDTNQTSYIVMNNRLQSLLDQYPSLLSNDKKGVPLEVVKEAQLIQETLKTSIYDSLINSSAPCIELVKNGSTISIPVQLIQQILNDPDTFSAFNNFNHSKFIFGNVSGNDYLGTILLYYLYTSEKGLDVVNKSYVTSLFGDLNQYMVKLKNLFNSKPSFSADTLGIKINGEVFSLYNYLKKSNSSGPRKYDTYNEFVAAYKEITRKWEQSLTKKEVELIRNYIGESDYSSYATMNSLMRGIAIDKDKKIITFYHMYGVHTYTFDEYYTLYKETVEQFIKRTYDEAITLNNAICRTVFTEDTIVARGVDFNALARFGVNHSDSPEQIMAKLGAVYTDAGFMSSTPVAGGGFTYKDVNFVMTCKKGMGFGDFSKWNSGEKEILLPLGSRFSVDRVEIVNGKIMVYMTSIL